MSLVFKTIQTEGIAELSYLVGDDDEGVAAVFDPRADCDVYLEAAREAGVSITHIFETHIHADLVSGSRDWKLQRFTPAPRAGQSTVLTPKKSKMATDLSLAK